MANPIVSKHLDDMPPFRAGDFTLLREVLHPQKESLELPFSLAHAFLEPGESSHPHRLAGQDEIYLILSGKGTLQLDDAAYPVRTGNVVLIPAGTVQWLVNEGDTKLELYCIVQPPWKKEDEAVWPRNTQGLSKR